MNTPNTDIAADQTAPETSAKLKVTKSKRRMARPAECAAVPAKAAKALSLPRKAGESAGSKTTAVIALLERKEGATLAELIVATSWLPHSARAALTGLRKKGHAIERGKRGDESCYRIASHAHDSVKAG